MAYQHFYPASEGQFYECLVCKESIYNPLCQNCLVNQMQAWLTSYPDLNKKLMPKLKRFLRDVHNETDEGVACAACKSKKASVCPYCFTEFVLGQLKKLQVHKQVIREFLVFFDFDFDGKGYTGKEAENYGVM